VHDVAHETVDEPGHPVDVSNRGKMSGSDDVHRSCRAADERDPVVGPAVSSSLHLLTAVAPWSTALEAARNSFGPLETVVGVGHDGRRG